MRGEFVSAGRHSVACSSRPASIRVATNEPAGVGHRGDASVTFRPAHDAASDIEFAVGPATLTFLRRSTTAASLPAGRDFVAEH
jgi:hypothetical protein